MKKFTDLDSISPTTSKLEAQKIAFGPIIFQVSKIMRLIDDQKNSYNYNFQIKSLTGNIVYHRKMDFRYNNTINIDISNLPAGLYITSLSFSFKGSFVKKKRFPLQLEHPFNIDDDPSSKIFPHFRH